MHTRQIRTLECSHFAWATNFKPRLKATVSRPTSTMPVAKARLRELQTLAELLKSQRTTVNKTIKHQRTTIGRIHEDPEGMFDELCEIESELTE
jgi:hypothetical protein